MVDQPESMSELPVEGAVVNSASPLPPGLTEEEVVDLQIELIKVGLLSHRALPSTAHPPPPVFPPSG